MAGRLQLPRKNTPNLTDQHVGARVRMRRKMVAMSQEKLGAALGLTFQQVFSVGRVGSARHRERISAPSY